MKILFLFIIILCSSCSYLQKYPQDNVVEEIAEEVIEKELGWDIDLSPFTPEKGE